MRRILRTTCENFTKFTTEVQLETKMKWLHFEVKRFIVQAHSKISGQRHADQQFTYLHVTFSSFLRQGFQTTSFLHQKNCRKVRTFIKTISQVQQATFHKDNSTSSTGNLS